MDREEAERIRYVAEAMGALTNRQWMVIFYRYYRNLPIERVAELAGVSERAALGTQARALRRMRRALNALRIESIRDL